ncbi:bifunctional 4-hydroxy-2-oxoglutarate aldolase/2-dehydro-3-deoxy-phosphogluconate aldolase [Faecalicatena contorta]|uniref:bifunctional 4-hydroxy-2-oxoglutarate aldolase/2-dehydro-3-deoxy-phosphogluconate aldolase n=1 Tax=Faecalicatena contorta TaxID=39482 RepID=UPI003217EECA
MKDIVKSIADEKIIAIIRDVCPKQIEWVVESLLEGNIKCMELAFSGGDNYDENKILKLIEAIRKKYNDEVLVGAGTVMTVEQVGRAYDAGAQYMISPNVNLEVISQTKKKGCVSIPGAYSPTEIIKAYVHGADFVKVFPAGNLGASYIKSLSVSLGKIPFIAVGGVNLENAVEFIDSGVTAVGIGGNLVDNLLIQQNKYQELAEKAKRYYTEVHKTHSKVHSC